MREAVSIVATCHHGFAGGGKNKTRVLHELAKIGYDINYVGIETPHLFAHIPTKVSIFLPKIPQSHVIKESEFLTEIALSQKMTEISIEKINKGKKVILFGTNLFPFVQITLAVKQNVYIERGIELPLISFPVGSDIWQIGFLQYYNVRRLLYSDLIDLRITYSKIFVEEIFSHYGDGKPFELIPPLLDTEVFNPIPIEKRTKLREQLGISCNDFVISHHSSMRPIKRPSDVLRIVETFSAKNSDKEIVLLMVGPIPDTIENRFITDIDKVINFNGSRIKVYRKNNLRIYWTALVFYVDLYLKISDVEINCSLHDSFNISLLEAMACGIPCITSDVTGISKAINNSKGGFLIPTKRYDFIQLNKILSNKHKNMPETEIEESINKLRFLLRNEEQRKEMGINAHRYVHTYFSSARIIEQYESLLNKIIS